MKRKILAAFFCVFLVMGAYSQERLAGTNDPNAAAGRGQAEIIINAGNADKDIAVWMNGAIVAHLPPKGREKIIVSNGRYTIEAADTTARGGQWNIGTKRQITIDANSNRTTIGCTIRYGALLNLTIQETTDLGGTVVAQPAAGVQTARQSQSVQSAPAVINSNSVESAVSRAAAVVEEGIPQGATLAILSMASDDKALAEFVIEELTYVLVNAKKFTVVDRESLHSVLAEQKFQLSGDVDDNTAVSIGKILGASIVITGTVGGSGTTRRLSVKALDVKTAKIEAMAREPF